MPGLPQMNQRASRSRVAWATAPTLLLIALGVLAQATPAEQKVAAAAAESAPADQPPASPPTQPAAAVIDVSPRLDSIDAALAKQFELLKQERNLKGLTAENFAERAAFHIGEINFIHPFREGNGRTMRLFLRELAQQAGHTIDIGRIDGRALALPNRIVV